MAFSPWTTWRGGGCAIERVIVGPGDDPIRFLMSASWCYDVNIGTPITSCPLQTREVVVLVGGAGFR